MRCFLLLIAAGTRIEVGYSKAGSFYWDEMSLVEL